MINRFLRLAALALLASVGIAANAASCPTTAISPDTALPAGAVGATYSQSFAASGGSALPYAFVVTAGLPAGFGLGIGATSGTTADLTGVPTRAGNFLVTVTATDGDGCSGGRTYALDIAHGSQTISFTSSAPANAAIGGAPYSVSASATSGLAVSFSIDAAAASVCAIAGSNVTFQAAGTCVIDAHQAGDANYSAAPLAQQSFAVGKADQTIIFTSTAPANAVVDGATYSVSASASSGLAVAFTIAPASASVCSIAGSVVSFHGTGTCTVDADQAGDASYNAAPQVQQGFAVGKGSQTITFTSVAPAGATVGGAPYSVSATASSSLAVAFTIAPGSASVCSIAGSAVSFQGAGTCLINANQSGNANYNAAPQVQQSFAVGIGSQTISFTSSAPVGAVVSGTVYVAAATATSGLPVTLTVDAAASAVCSIAGATVSFQGVGTCVINANQSGNANYGAAPQVQQSFAVGKGSQTITFTSVAPAGATVGGAPYSVSATASSGLAVAFTIAPASASVCSIAGSIVSFLNAGTCVVNANQSGNTNYNAAPQVQQSFAVGAGSQTISFTSSAPAGAVVGGAAYVAAATATSGLPVTLTVDAAASAVCSIAGSTVSFQGVGTCVIDANQAGNANYGAAPQVQQSFAVGKGSQTITFTSTAPAGATVGGAPYGVSATASSGLAIAFTIAPGSASVCAIAGSAVSFHGIGTCLINANQSGNANYNAAPQVQQSFAVGVGSQTISFTSPTPVGAVVSGTVYIAAATATSGLPVTLTVDAAASAVCSIAGSTVSFQSVGTCVINANQAGNANYGAAPQVQQSFAVGKGSQAITFTSPVPAGAVVAGATYVVTATSSAGLPVTFTIDASASAVCSIAGSSVSFLSAGTCVVNANQSGNANYNAAPQVQQSFAVGKGSQTIGFTSTAPASANVGGTTYTVAATASSGLPVALTIDASASSVCAISGATVSFLAAGTCVIDANQAGDGNWNAAPQVQQSFAISACVSPVVGQVVLGAMPGGANVCVTNTDGANAEYTYLPINIGTSADSVLSLTASNIVPVTGPPTPIAPSEAKRLDALKDIPAVDVHAVVAPPAIPAGYRVDASALVRSGQVAAVPLAVGQLIDLNASVGDCTTPPDVRKGRVEAITTAQSPGQPLLYAVQEVVETTPGAGDWHAAIVGGFQTVDFQNIIDAFVQTPTLAAPYTPNGSVTLAGQLKTAAMDMFTTNFGAVSDIDNNGGVIVFFTRKMNELSPPASSTVAQGLFQSRDLVSAAACNGSNQGEIVYMLMPDPTGSVNSNVRTVSFVYGSAGPTLVHHFEHLVNAARRLYFNSGAPLEATWLDEALAWEVQEMAFFNASAGLAPRGNIQLSTLTTGPFASVRVADFNAYENTIYGSMRAYFLLVNASNGNKRFGPLRQQGYVAGGNTSHDTIVQSFGITSAFLRYALDRKNTGDAALLQALVNSNQAGIGNLQTVFGVDPNDWMRDFLVAMYADDAVAGVDPQYTAPSWNYRSVYGGLGGFPLTVDPLTSGVPLSFTLSYGGGTRYTRFGVAPGQTATVALTEGGVVPTTPTTTALVRTK